MGKSMTLKRTAYIIVFLAIVQFILYMSLLARGQEYVAVSLMIDDTYYYMQTAWNTRHLGFATFDGLNPTNGVQFLWFLLILALTFVVQSKSALMFATLLMAFLLNVLSFFFIYKIGATLKRPTLALIMGGLWSLQSLPFRIYSTGMENSLHALVIWAIVWQATIFLTRVQQGLKPNFWGLTIVLTLNAWTRLDSALLSVVVYLFCIGALARRWHETPWSLWQQYGKSITGTVLLAASGLVVQLGAFWLMDGTVFPVSALVKSSGDSRGFSLEAAEKLLDVLLLGMPSIIQGRLPALVLVLGAILIIATVIRARMSTRHTQEMRALLNLWSCLLVVELVYMMTVALTGVQYTDYFMWYRSPSFIFWILTASLVSVIILDGVRSVRRFDALEWAPLVLACLAFATSIYMFVRSVDFVSELYVARYEAALWIAENAPADTVYAAWNTGQLGYFSDRTFINLDGVINSNDYYERILLGPTSALADYLAENRVRYIVDYALYNETPELRVVRAFPIHDETGRSIQIWQITPQQTTAQ